LILLDLDAEVAVPPSDSQKLNAWVKPDSLKFGRFALRRIELDVAWKGIIGQQFVAAIDMLENAMRACPDKLWGDRTEQPEFWYTVYHALFWLDLYLSGAVEGFAPPTSFNLDELDPAGLLPDRVYTKAELQAYLDHCREKLLTTLDVMTDEKLAARCRFGWGEVSFAELLLYNMRHVQDHAGQLNHILGSAPDWVTGAKRVTR
jgi:hypothetical protein